MLAADWRQTCLRTAPHDSVTEDRKVTAIKSIFVKGQCQGWRHRLWRPSRLGPADWVAWGSILWTWDSISWTQVCWPTASVQSQTRCHMSYRQRMRSCVGCRCRCRCCAARSWWTHLTNRSSDGWASRAPSNRSERRNSMVKISELHCVSVEILAWSLSILFSSFCELILPSFFSTVLIAWVSDRMIPFLGHKSGGFHNKIH